MPEINTLVIRDFASLQAWRQELRTIIRPRGLSIIQLQLPELADEQNRSLAALANDYLKACGCVSGSFFMSAAVVVLVVSYFGSGGHLNLTHILSLVGITALAALVGKLWGLIWARWRLLRLADYIYDLVARSAQCATR